jgi:hypothetical protein
MCLTNHYTMKAYGGVVVWLHIFLTLALVAGEWSALPLGKKPWYTLGRRLGEPQSRPGRRGEEKILDPTGTQTPTPQLSSPIANHYTDCAITALTFLYEYFFNLFVVQKHAKQ